MIVLLELGLVELVKMIEPFPQFAFLAGIGLVLLALAERDVRMPALDEYQAAVIERIITLVSGQFSDLKIAARCLKQGFEIRAIVGVTVGDFDARHDVGLDAAHQMNLKPVVLLLLLSILRVEPARKLPRGKAGRVNREIQFDTLERQAGFDDELFQVRSQGFHLKVIGDGIKVRNLRDVAALLPKFWAEAAWG